MSTGKKYLGPGLEAYLFLIPYHMEPHGQSPWYLHKISSYAKASEGYPPSAKSAEAAILQLMINPGTVYAFIHG